MRNLRNSHLVLKKRPDGIAGPEHFEAKEAEARSPAAGEVLLETLYLSIDPAMRVWISEEPGYVEPVPIGGTMRGGAIGRVLESAADGLEAGDLVAARTGWQSHPTVAADAVQKLDGSLGSPLDWIGPLGTSGLTAYFGLERIGRIEPGETLLVSAASGAVGQMAAQIGKLKGCTVVGLAGGREKCRFLLDEIGVDDAIDYKSSGNLVAALRRACPGGIDVFFDNVAGPTLDAALACLADHGRVIVCGRISQTASTELYGVRNLGVLIGRRARLEGFIVSDYASEFDAARRWIADRLRDGSLKQKVHVIDGLEAAPGGLSMLFRGENTGKLVVRLAE